jgi:tryptophan synthase
MGEPGVLHGVRTYILQSPAGQIVETHSVSAGLDYPGVGPEHAWLKDSGRAEYAVATDEEALRGFRLCTQLEGIIPGTPSFQGRTYAPNHVDIKSARIFTCSLGGRSPRQNLTEKSGRCASMSLLPLSVTPEFHISFSQCLSGRGDKDVEQISQLLPGKWADILDWHVSSSSSSPSK